MLSFFFWHILPIILALAVLVEGFSVAAWLLSQPSDIAVMLGVLVVVLTPCAFGSFVVWRYRKHLDSIKENL